MSETFESNAKVFSRLAELVEAIAVGGALGAAALGDALSSSGRTSSSSVEEDRPDPAVPQRHHVHADESAGRACLPPIPPAVR